ncbi:hypothetical protein [Vibrio parahaemolyticus]|uniref:hypothetical protein n=1 Tax=Vibrio parahaemolyticus TaxID=670 RepID=UPI0004DB909D|nr:hypothetical protein [Vibrio parahaemolyticus]MBE3735775.1 hypothetical protein [Vibrio parahaemolyticus]MBE3902126.1 hypothetical protein [Vibrio parahaemolyticus]HCE4621535.1 hypothetical protein [Vibrio parahaemolyticus]
MKAVIEYLANASRHMQNVYLLVFIAIAFIFRITLSIYTSESDPTLVEYIAGNLLPEVTGMLIELVLILVVVEAIQSGESKKRKQAELDKIHRKQVMLERRLRAQLRFLLKRIFGDTDLIDGSSISTFLFHASNHEENQHMLSVLKQTLFEEAQSESFRENLHESCQLELSLILALTPVCSGLSDRHVKAWMSIAHYLQQINTKNDVVQNTEKLLSWIAFFDKQTVSQNLVE